MHAQEWMGLQADRMPGLCAEDPGPTSPVKSVERNRNPPTHHSDHMLESWLPLMPHAQADI
jgi:hypothetical protein